MFPCMLNAVNVAMSAHRNVSQQSLTNIHWSSLPPWPPERLSVSTPALPETEPTPHIFTLPSPTMIWVEDSGVFASFWLTLSQEIRGARSIPRTNLPDLKDTFSSYASPNLFWSNLMVWTFGHLQNVLSELVFPSPLCKEHPPLLWSELHAFVRELNPKWGTVCDSGSTSVLPEMLECEELPRELHPFWQSAPWHLNDLGNRWNFMDHWF